MLTLLLSAMLGTLIGIVTAIVPGLHVNTIALLSVGIAIKYQLSPLSMAVFVFTASIAHLFVEFLPSIFLSLVDSSTALVVQPAQRLLMKGHGYEVVKLTTYGGLCGFAAAILFLPLFYMTIPPLYSAIRPSLGWMLLTAIIILIAFEKRRMAALSIFLLSGLFGIICLQNTTINTHYLLFPLLTGLFGLSSLLLMTQTKTPLPKQRTNARVSRKVLFKGSVTGIGGGILSGFLPGMGSSQSLVFAQSIFRFKGMRTFLVAQGAINVSDIILSLMAVLLIGNPRSGVAVSLMNLLPAFSYTHLLLLLLFGGAAAIVGAYTTLLLGKHAASVLPKLPATHLAYGALIFLLVLIFGFTGAVGLLYAITGAGIGVLGHHLNVKKSLLMGSLMIPTTLFFLGWDRAVLHFIGF